MSGADEEDGGGDEDDRVEFSQSSSVGSDVRKMLEEQRLNQPTAFFDARTGEEVNEEQLTHTYTERVYYGSNGAPDEFEMNFAVSKRYIWNEKDKDQKAVITSLHTEFVKEWKAKNDTAVLYFKDRKINLPFKVSTTMDERDATESLYPPRFQTKEYWEKKREQKLVEQEHERIAQQLEELKQKEKELAVKSKAIKTEVKKSKRLRAEESDSDASVQEATPSRRGASTGVKRAYHHYIKHAGTGKKWLTMTPEEKADYYKEHQDEIDGK
jgi:hypothetical protein